MGVPSESTNVGSIHADLKIDASEWNRDLDAAEAKARELGNVDPTVKIDVKGAEGAATKLDAVAAAERRVELAQRQAANTASTSYIANERLKEIQEKRGATELQVAAATEAAARADRNAEAAELRHMAAVEALNKAKEQAAKKSLEAAAANEALDKSEKDVANSADRGGRAINVLWAALAALAPAAVPLAAVAVAGTGALTLMGLAGVAAVKGIKDEMQSGTEAGNKYSAGIAMIKADLDELEHSGADGMMQGFARSIEAVDDYMPMLNAQTSTYSAMLGHIGSTALTGVLGALDNLEPVLKSAGGWLGYLVDKLALFANSDGMRQFADYALSELPQVSAVLESLITGAFHLLDALAPLGGLGLTVLKGIGDTLNAIPTPVLTVLTSGALAAYGAFASWRALIPVLQSFGIALDMSLGPVGLVVAGVGLIAGAMIGAAAATDQNTTSALSYSAALQQDNYVIGEHIRLQAAKAAAEKDAAAATDLLGINTKTLTDAIMGDAAAQDNINNKLEVARGIINDHTQGVVDMNTGMYVATQRQNELGKAVDEVTKVLNGNKGAINDAVENQHRIDSAMGQTTASAQAQGGGLAALAGRYGMSVASYMAAQDAQQKSQAQLDQTTASMFVQNNAAGLLKQALDLLNGKAISAAQAQNNFDSAIANMSTHLDATGKTINRADTDLAGMTASAVKNRGELITLTTAAQASAQAFRDNGGSADETRQKLINMKQQIIDNAVAHGEDRAAVEEYVNSIFKIPASIPPTKIDVDTAAANAKIAEVQARLDAIHGHTAYINVDVTNSASAQSQIDHIVHGPEAYATGGLIGHRNAVRRLAAGGWADATGGGLIYGPGTPTSDSVPILASRDEFMTRASSVASIGPENMEYMNRTGKLLTEPVPVPVGGGNLTVQLVLDKDIIDQRIIDLSTLTTNNALHGVAQKMAGMRR